MVADGFIWIQNDSIVSNSMTAMAKEDLLEGLRDLEQGEPGTATAQLREIKDEIDALLAKRYTQKQIWNALTERGLKLTFSGFKTSLYRMQENVNKSQKVSNSFEKCPHCDGELVGGVGAVEGPEGAESATGLQTAAQPSECPVDTSEPAYKGMGEIFARRLQSGSLSRGLSPTAPIKPVHVPGTSDSE